MSKPSFPPKNRIYQSDHHRSGMASAVRQFKVYRQFVHKDDRITKDQLHALRYFLDSTMNEGDDNGKSNSRSFSSARTERVTSASRAPQVSNSAPRDLLSSLGV